MNKNEVSMQLRDLQWNLKRFTEVESTEDDVQAIEYAIKAVEIFPSIEDIDKKIKYFESVVCEAYFAKQIGDTEVGKNLELFTSILNDYKSIKIFLEDGAVG